MVKDILRTCRYSSYPEIEYFVHSKTFFSLSQKSTPDDDIQCIFLHHHSWIKIEEYCWYKELMNKYIRGNKIAVLLIRNFEYKTT